MRFRVGKAEVKDGAVELPDGAIVFDVERVMLRLGTGIEDLEEIVTLVYLVPEKAAQKAPEPVRKEAVQVTLDQVKAAFPEDLMPELTFKATDEHIVIEPIHYLGSDNFRRVSGIVRDQLQGEYVSAGKDSHFRIPRKKEAPET